MLSSLQRCCFRFLTTQVEPSRHVGQMANLVKRDIVDPRNLTADDLKTLMWTAIDLKCLPAQKQSEVQLALLGCNATLIMSKPCIRNQVGVSSALQHVGCSFNAVMNQKWEVGNPYDLGRSLSSITDLILVDACDHKNVVMLCDGATIPVINIDSRKFKPIKVLADLMTAQEHYGCLKRLRVGFVGPRGSYLDTYLLMCAKLGMHFQFLCLGDDEFPSDLLERAMKIASENNAEVHQCDEFTEALYRAHVVVTTKHTHKNVQITKEELREAAVDWTLAHDLPRSTEEVSEDVIMSQNSLVWASWGNFMWIVMAMALHVKTGYKPNMQCPPDFDGDSGDVVV